jgi:polyphosphate:AMP phosphotransferase
MYGGPARLAPPGRHSMFRTAELGRKVSKAEYRERVGALRQALLETQNALRHADFPVIVLFGGVDGAGKGDTVNALNEWMDPRWMVTRAFDEPGEEELERPEYWRYWRALPPKGQIGLLMSAWYSRPLVDRAYGGSDDELEVALGEIAAFEKQLADDGALILKFWLHLGKGEQEKRFRRLEKDPLQSWRVTERDWENWHRYEHFVAAAERIITRTSTGDAPWHIVEGRDARYANLRVGDVLLGAIQERLEERARENHTAAVDEASAPVQSPDLSGQRTVTVLSSVDTSKKLAKPEYRKLLATYQGRINRLQKRARDQGVSTILVFEGWDAAGKGGTIRRINSALDSRGIRVIPTAAPTDEERAQHYLWRFWKHLSRAGRVTIFDRSWYGRVLVERVEGFASEREWRRAYAEINRFEKQLVDHGIVLAKFWLHITKEEQLRRFREREQTPYKRWKLGEEDWRNRERWEDYELAAHDMVERTSTTLSPWHLVPANDKCYARVEVLKQVSRALEARVGNVDDPPPRQKKRSKS